MTTGRYTLASVDLRDVEDMQRVVSQVAKLSEDVPTLVISELVLIYMERGESDALISFAAAHFRRGLFLNFEQVGSKAGGQDNRWGTRSKDSPKLTGSQPLPWQPDWAKRRVWRADDEEHRSARLSATRHPCVSHCGVAADAVHGPWLFRRYGNVHAQVLYEVSSEVTGTGRAALSDPRPLTAPTERQRRP